MAVVTDAGTPGISDPAFLLVREAIRAGVTVIPVPGASAVLSALVASGLPLERFVFEGFLPVKKGRRTRLEELRGERRTIVLYEAPHRLRRTLRDLLEVMGDRNIAVAREITKKFEEILRGPLSEVLAAVERKEPRGEYVIVVAGVDRQTGEETHETEDEDGEAGG